MKFGKENQKLLQDSMRRQVLGSAHILQFSDPYRRKTSGMEVKEVIVYFFDRTVQESNLA